MTKKFLAVVLLAIAPVIFYEIGVFAYWMFLFGMCTVSECHKDAWSTTTCVLMTIICISLFIGGLRVAFFKSSTGAIEEHR